MHCIAYLHPDPGVTATVASNLHVAGISMIRSKRISKYAMQFIQHISSPCLDACHNPWCSIAARPLAPVAMVLVALVSIPWQ